MTHIEREDHAETLEPSDCGGDAHGFRVRKPNRTRRQPGGSKQRIISRGDDPARAAAARPAVRRQRPGRPREFRCRHCRAFVVSLPSGGRHRNHCPACLHSRHVDERVPGDRLSTCGGTMAPLGAFVRPGGEYALVHRCFGCGVVRHTRVAADDDFALVLRLPDLSHRLPARATAYQAADGVTA